jgi:transposase
MIRKKGALVAMVEGTKADVVALCLSRIPVRIRRTVSEVSLDLSPTMKSIASTSFPCARITSDRFHVQQLVSDALQDIRIGLRSDAMRAESEAILKARKESKKYVPIVHTNGDTDRQLLARSRYVLFKPESTWHESQKERAAILFARYPNLKHAYHLSMMFRSIYENSTTKEAAKEKLDTWYLKIETSLIKEFEIPMMTIRAHEDTILNYFVNRSTNAAAESFNGLC